MKTIQFEYVAHRFARRRRARAVKFLNRNRETFEKLFLVAVTSLIVLLVIYGIVISTH
jgi:hypothetical protein